MAYILYNCPPTRSFFTQQRQHLRKTGRVMKKVQEFCSYLEGTWFKPDLQNWYEGISPGTLSMNNSSEATNLVI